MKKLLLTVVVLVLMAHCTKNKCVVCNDYNGKQTGLKCFHTTEEALSWQAAQDSNNIGQPLDCDK